MTLLDVSEYATPGQHLPYTGLPIVPVIVAALLLLVIAGVIWACLAVAGTTDRRDGR